MKKLLLIAAAVLAGASGLRAEEYTAISPDGKITVTVSTAPELRWSVTREGERLLDASRIGMKIAGAEPFGAAPSCGGPNRRRIDERSTAPVPDQVPHAARSLRRASAYVPRRLGRPLPGLRQRRGLPF